MSANDRNFYQRRLMTELRAAERAITPAARERRMLMAETFSRKLAALGA